MSIAEPPHLSANQRKTARARQAFNERFTSPDEKRQYFRALGERSNARRVALRPEERAVLAQAADILARLTGQEVSDDTA